jgi:hypothetical protein
MEAREFFEMYKKLEASEALKFDILHDSHLKKREQDLQAIREELSNEIDLPAFNQSYVDKNILNLPHEMPGADLVGVSFTIDDIVDKEALEVAVEKEALEIYKSETARAGRDLETVKYFVKQGKIAEFWLIENRGHKPAEKKWHDLLDPQGDLVEVKAYDIWSKDAPGVQRDIKKLRTSSWNFSKWYVLFKCKNGVYDFLEKIQLR